MPHSHETESAEELALLWHRLGLAISIVSTALSIGGVCWHIWAVAQHQDALKRIHLVKPA